MYNKVVLRISLQQPVPSSIAAVAQTPVCILKSTAFSTNPVIVSNPTARQPNNPDGSLGALIYSPDQLLTVIPSSVGGTVIFSYTSRVGVYVESINNLRIVSGLANLVFAK
jgi:hypothetical protein